MLAVLAWLKGSLSGLNATGALIKAGVVVLVILLSFQWGQASQKSRHEKQQRELAERYAESVAEAVDRAYARGRAATEKEAQNAQNLKEIDEAADGAENAGDACIPADVVRRLHELQ